MNRHLMKAEMANEQKIARALESVSKIEERIQETEAKKRVGIGLFSTCTICSRGRRRARSP